MHIAEFTEGERLHLLSGPDENRSVTRGCGYGCILGVLLPLLIAIVIPLTLAAPWPVFFLSTWGTLALLAVLSSAELFATDTSSIRIDKNEGIIEWGEHAHTSSLALSELHGCTLRYAGNGKSTAELTLELNRGEEAAAPRFLKMIRILGSMVGLPTGGRSRQANKLTFSVDWLARPEEFRDLGHRLAGVLGYFRFDESEDDEDDDRRITLTYRPNAEKVIPKTTSPFPAYGEGAFENAMEDPRWQNTEGSKDWRENVGVTDHMPGTRLVLTPEGWRIPGILAMILLGAVLGGLGFLIARPDLLPGWAYHLLLFLAAGVLASGSTLLFLHAAPTHRRGMTIEKEITFTGPKAPDPVPVEDLIRIVLPVHDTESLFLESKTGLIPVPVHTSTADEESVLALARALSDITRLPVERFGPI